MKHYIIFHTKKIDRAGIIPCIDGIFAAYALFTGIKPDRTDTVILLPGEYDKPPQVEFEWHDKIYLLDITYPASVINSWVDRGAFVRVIDHHKTAMNDLSQLSDRIFQKFDMDQSGAVLAWRYAHSEPVPPLFLHVQDRDLWTKELPNTDLIHLALQERLNGLMPDGCIRSIERMLEMPIEDLAREGGLIKHEIDQAIDRACQRRSWKKISGFRVPFVQVRGAREKQAYSDIGHKLLDIYPDAPFACVQVGNGWSLRSTNDRVDVSVIAKHFGGGGHRNASGCAAQYPIWHWKYWRKMLQKL